MNAPNETCGICNQSAPQPAEGDGAVACERCGGHGWIEHNAGAGIGRITEDEFCPDCEGDTRPSAATAVPDGWKLVPIVATPSMDAAGKEALSDNGVADVHDADALVCFAAMLAAAPAAPKGGVE